MTRLPSGMRVTRVSLMVGVLLSMASLEVTLGVAYTLLAVALIAAVMSAKRHHPASREGQS